MKKIFLKSIVNFLSAVSFLALFIFAGLLMSPGSLKADSITCYDGSEIACILPVTVAYCPGFSPQQHDCPNGIAACVPAGVQHSCASGCVPAGGGGAGALFTPLFPEANAAL